MTARWRQLIEVGGHVVVQGAASCDNCGLVSVGMRPLDAHEGAHSPEEKFETGTLRWYPSEGVSPEFPDVPEAIATAAKEAHASRSIGANMAAILMARTVVEASAKERGIATGSLFAKIDAMRSADLIRASTAEATHEIRHFGNDMAHGDIGDVPSDDDADDVLQLMNELLREVFQGPALSARIKAKRLGTM